MIAVIDGNENKCKDCKWLTGKRKRAKIECMNPEKQKRFAELDRMRSSLNSVPSMARYKYPSYKACKKFEAKDERAMDTV